MKNQNLLALFVFIAGPIALFASSDTDRKIEDAAKASYNYRTVLEDHVKVSVTDGIVTLTGTVQDKDDKALAADTVENLPGVLSVDNEIKVEPTFPSTPMPGWPSRFAARSWCTPTSVRSTRRSSSKTASSPFPARRRMPRKKDLTEAYAKDIDGVKSVTNDLVVTSPPADQQTVGEKIDDASITSQVKYSLLSHKSTSAIETHVTTTDGVVHVTGEADSAAERSLVTKLAQDVRGTKSVTNDMTVKELSPSHWPRPAAVLSNACGPTLVGRMFSGQKRKATQPQPSNPRSNEQNILPFAPVAGTSSASGPGLYSDHMLAELLALQERDDRRQLRLERLRVADSADFLTDMIDHFLTGVIDQHEKAAVLLRTQLENDIRRI